MIDSQLCFDDSEVIEFNGTLDDVAITIRSIFKNEISIVEAKFIVGVLVEKRNYDYSASLTKIPNDELEDWVDSKAADAGADTKIGYIVLQTSKLKIEAIHLVYTFFLSYLVFSDPINYLAVFSIELIWFLVTSIKLIKDEEDKIVMATIIEKNVGGSGKMFTVDDIHNAMENRQSDENKGDNIQVLDKEVIKESLLNLAEDDLVKPLDANHWKLGCN